MRVRLPADGSLARSAAFRAEVEQALTSELPGRRASIQWWPSNVEAQFDALNEQGAPT